MTDATPASGPATVPVPSRRRRTPYVMGIHVRDFGVLGTAAMATVGSAGAYYTVTTTQAPPLATSFSAWHGYLGGSGVVLALAAAAVVAAGLLGVVGLASARPVALVLCLAAAACTLASYVVTPGGLCSDLVYLESGCEGAVVGRGDAVWRTLMGTGGGAFIALYWYVVEGSGRAPGDDSSQPVARW